jgi:hypothetical protein
MNKSINSIIKGIKKGYSVPTLPNHIIEFTNKPLIRILRFIGGVSFITMMSKSYLHYPLWVLAILTFFTLIFTIYHFYLAYHRFKHMRYLFKSGAYEVRNSPIDRLAFLAARAIGCLKGVCDSAQPVGLGLGLMVTTDEFLKAANVEPIFTPFIGNALKSVLPDSASRIDNKLLNSNIEQVTSNNVELKASESLLERFKDLNLRGDFTNDEFSELKKLILENQEQLKSKNTELKDKINELLDKKIK